MTSLFTAFVTQVAYVPEVDPRIASHADICEVVSDDDRPAAPADVLLDSTAPAEASVEPSESTMGEGTKSPTQPTQ